MPRPKTLGPYDGPKRKNEGHVKRVTVAVQGEVMTVRDIAKLLGVSHPKALDIARLVAATGAAHFVRVRLPGMPGRGMQALAPGADDSAPRPKPRPKPKPAALANNPFNL